MGACGGDSYVCPKAGPPSSADSMEGIYVAGFAVQFIDLLFNILIFAIVIRALIT